MTTDIERAVASLALEHKLLTPSTAHAMITEARTSGRSLVDLIRNRVSEDNLLQAVAGSLGMRYYSLFSTTQEFRVDDAVLARADMAYLKRFSALPMVDKSGKVVVAIANPADVEVIDYLRSRYPEGMLLVLTSKSQIQNKLAYFGVDSAAAALAEERPLSATTTVAAPLPTNIAGRSAVVNWLDATLTRAAAENVSDLHFSFNANKTLNLRFRLDGVLQAQQVPLPPDRGLEVIGSLLSKTDSMDSSNYREPQDGTFSFNAAGRKIDVRVAMLPMIYGPTVVLRLLDSSRIQTRLDDMGFSPEALTAMRTAAASSAGTILVSGPTGSGKSTTLYSLIRELDAISKNVITVEDPVEYKLPHILQTAIRSDLGEKSLTFARALRSILRLDPDIILVGEIRDAETARIAMDAAITGHLVLSTVHAPSAIGVYTRLIEMGVPPYMVAEALTLTVAQRLLRRVHECARIETPTRDEVVWFAEQGHAVPELVAHPVGCMGCNGGYRDRIAVVELLEPTRRMRSLVATRAGYEEIEAEALAAGFKPILHDGLRHVAGHRTTVAEVIRVLSTAEERH